MAEIVKKERVPYRIWDKVNSKWNELMLKTNAKSVDAADGKTLETKIGAVNGITSDLNGEAEDVAASIKCVNQLNNSLTASDSLKFQFATDGEGNYGYLKGDDTFVPFKSGYIDMFNNLETIEAKSGISSNKSISVEIGKTYLLFTVNGNGSGYNAYTNVSASDIISTIKLGYYSVAPYWNGGGNTVASCKLDIIKASETSITLSIGKTTSTGYYGYKLYEII